MRVEPIVCPRGHAQATPPIAAAVLHRPRSAAQPTCSSGQREATQQGLATDALTRMRDLAFELRERLGAGDVDALPGLLARELGAEAWSGGRDQRRNGRWLVRAARAGRRDGRQAPRRRRRRIPAPRRPARAARHGPGRAPRAARGAPPFRRARNADRRARKGRGVKLVDRHRDDYLDAARRGRGRAAHGAARASSAKCSTAPTGTTSRSSPWATAAAPPPPATWRPTLRRTRSAPNMRRFRIMSLNDNAAILTRARQRPRLRERLLASSSRTWSGRATC